MIETEGNIQGNSPPAVASWDSAPLSEACDRLAGMLKNLGLSRSMKIHPSEAAATPQAMTSFTNEVVDALEYCIETSAHAHRLESIGQLAAGVAHEINTPIQFISDNTAFLKRAFETLLNTQELDSKNKNFMSSQIPAALDEIIEGLQRVIIIVSSMKRLSRVSDRCFEQVSLKEIVDTVSLISRSEWKYCAQLDVNIASGVDKIQSKSQDLYSVILNLVVNASHAIKEEVSRGRYDKGSITITVDSMPDGVSIRVKDNGCGISPEIRRKIFKPFFSTKPVGQGTGQGLAIVRAAVEDELNGRITLSSNPGVGTEFVIELPGDAR
nr:HAMP domain-containing histidine kinase [Oceanococcus sp. HetDA_MAG_MS8]